MTPKVVQILQARQLRHRSRSTAGGGILNESVRMRRDLAAADDRRGSQRFKISVPITVIAEDREIPAYTRDLSNRGVYFYLALADSALIDSSFQFLVELPSEITLSTGCRVRCRARLVRKEMTSKNFTETGLAAEILDYSILGNAVSPA
ncbi:MAG TPA: PilZ domain-containing protein [Terracidiphilus sp.]|nr:PilZ domain-containing protein [Terracidiphilus sp.]